jgi:dihydropteroate synthase
MTLSIHRPMIMGILNITPDSFSDAGLFKGKDSAIKHALDMANEGADIIDIGGESTRPGAERISAEEQISRVIPVIEAICSQLPPQFPISIDTTLSEVARIACETGANIINDISAGEDDPEMFALAAELNLPLILMHKQGSPEAMQISPHYDNVVEDIRAYLLGRADKAKEAGMVSTNIIIDPGIGFGKTNEQNLLLMNNLNRFVDTGYAVLLGTSRKKFLKKISKVEDSRGLVGATCATTVMAIMAGVQIIRVHDVKQNKQALEVAYAMGQI